MKAGIKKASAKIHAVGSPKQTARQPKAGTASRLTSIRAIISKTPESMARLVYPTPWIVYRRMQSSLQTGKKETEMYRNNSVFFHFSGCCHKSNTSEIGCKNRER
jgi:hypothetical protein